MPEVEQGPRGLAARSPVGRPRVPAAAAQARPVEQPQPVRRRARRDAPASEPAAAQPVRKRAPRKKAAPGTDLVPMTTVDAMERLSGELYAAGQRAARAEAVAEMRLRRLGDLEERGARLEQEIERLQDERQELLQRVAMAEARAMVLEDAPATRWGLRRRG